MTLRESYCAALREAGLQQVERGMQLRRDAVAPLTRLVTARPNSTGRSGRACRTPRANWMRSRPNCRLWAPLACCSARVRLPGRRCKQLSTVRPARWMSCAWKASRSCRRLWETLAEIGEPAQADKKRLQEVARDLRDSFFLVAVVGEFNAGKSTFINALLGEALLPTGITPTTETIELIQYAEQPRRKPLLREDGLREWAHPGTGAPGVALVDTPGTGSVFRTHERIALEFLHRSDLVLFVIPARRALAETGRVYLELAQQYGKKIIIIINQIDQLEPSEQAEVRRFVERQARELLNLQPLIFMVSARQSLAQAQGARGTRTVWTRCGPIC